MNKHMEIEKNLDFANFNENKIISFIERADSIFQEEIKLGDIVICKIDKADKIEYEEATRQSIEQAAKETVLFYSPDGTIESGLKELTKKSKLHDAPALVGWLLTLSIRNDR